MSNGELTKAGSVIRGGGINRLFARGSHGIAHAAGRYDAKTLLRHAMISLEDQMGIQEAQPFNAKLREVFVAIRKWEEHHIAGVRK